MVALIISVPAIGFLVNSIIHNLAGGYFGSRFSFGVSYARIAIALAIAKNHRNFKKWRKIASAKLKIDQNCSPENLITELVCADRLKVMDPDVLFCLSTREVFIEKARYLMPDLLTQNARRRWTAVWASWNSAIGIILGYVSFYIYYTQNKEMKDLISDYDGSYLGLAIPLAFLIFLLYTGWSARRDVWDLELGWVINSKVLDVLKAPEERVDSNLFLDESQTLLNEKIHSKAVANSKKPQ